MDIERDGVMVKDVERLNPASLQAECQHFTFSKADLDRGIYTYYDDTWRPVSPWVTIEVDRETFERLYGDLPAGYSDVFLTDYSERGTMIGWRKTQPPLPQNEARRPSLSLRRSCPILQVLQ